MTVPALADIERARGLLSDQLERTRLVPASSIDATNGLGVLLELASSTGNHGAAVARAARRLGVPATIFLPEGLA